MPKTVTIPGYDKPIDFPDSMSQDQINAASKKLYEAKQTVTPTPGSVLRPLTQRERFLDPNLYPVGAKGEGVGENLHNIAQRAGVGVFQFADALTHPRQTVAGMLSSVLPEPVVKGVNKVVDLENKIPGAHYLTTKLPEGTENPVKSAYDAVEPGGMDSGWKRRPYGGADSRGRSVGRSGAGDCFGRCSYPRRDIETIPRVLRPLVEKTREAQKAATESADEYANAIKQKTGEIAADQSEKSKAAKAKGIEQERTHQKSVEETKAANKAAIREQEKIAPTKEKLQKSVQEMQAQVETARNNALKEGNKKYSAVNAALNHISADPEFMQGALADSLEAIKGTSTEPTILKDMMRKSERGEVATYEDLQGYYSELGTELSKGNVPGDLYHAYDTIHEAIGDEMQRIADANGQGPQLKAARDYWRRMKQAFGKQYNPTDTGNAVLRNTAGDVMRRSQEAEPASPARFIRQDHPADRRAHREPAKRHRCAAKRAAAPLHPEAVAGEACACFAPEV